LAETADVTDTVDGAGVDESFFLPNKFENIFVDAICWLGAILAGMYVCVVSRSKLIGFIVLTVLVLYF
jgi:hypothetical protein